MKSKCFGPYVAHDWPNDLVHDKTSGRNAHVTGPDINGRICPIASCRTFNDAVKRAKALYTASINPDFVRAVVESEEFEGKDGES